VKVLVNRNDRYDAVVGDFPGYWFSTYVTGGLAVLVVAMTGTLGAGASISVRKRAARIRMRVKNA
jgi:hypothetical protein